MRVLTIYAHHNPHSFNHALLERFSAGVRDAGHTNEVVDLHAIGFDPVLRARDAPDWIDEDVPDDVLANMKVEKSLYEAATNGWQRRLLKHWIGGRDARGILRKLRAQGAPEDVAEQQAKLARADALVLISPVYFMGFPAILKGWIDRVFSLRFAFGFTADAWRGDVAGRLPLLTIQKALILSTTIFDEHTYDQGHRAAMKTLIDDYCLRYPGIEQVQHEYFYAVHGADDAVREQYLQRAYQLGRELFAPGQTARRPYLGATTETTRRLERQSLVNLSKMGHCAPAIMQTLLDASETRCEWLIHLCAGLPGGIADTGEECGGITAPLVLLGLRYAHEPDRNGLPPVIEKGHDLIQRFTSQRRSSSCREIRGTSRVPLQCVQVVRSAPVQCAESVCHDCSASLSSEQQASYAQLHAYFELHGFHCAHDVFRALGGRVSEAAELRQATSAFVGGTVFTGRTCSALTAGVMALGLLAGRRENSRMRVARMMATMAVGGAAFADKLNEFSVVMNEGHRLAEWFVTRYGSSQCRALTGCDFSKHEGVERYVTDSCLTRCRAIAEGVAARVAQMSTRSVRQLPVLES